MMPQIYSGARVTISVNGTVVAAAFVADYTIDTGASEINGVDYVFPVELAPSRIRVGMNLRVYRTPDNDPVALGIAPGGGTLGVPEQQNYLRSKYITIEVKDTNDQTVFYAPKAWLTRRSAALAVGDLISENWSIVCIGGLTIPQ